MPTSDPAVLCRYRQTNRSQKNQNKSINIAQCVKLSGFFNKENYIFILIYILVTKIKPNQTGTASNQTMKNENKNNFIWFYR